MHNEGPKKSSRTWEQSKIDFVLLFWLNFFLRRTCNIYLENGHNYNYNYILGNNEATWKPSRKNNMEEVKS